MNFAVIDRDLIVWGHGETENKALEMALVMAIACYREPVFGKRLPLRALLEWNCAVVRITKTACEIVEAAGAEDASDDIQATPDGLFYVPEYESLEE